MLPFSSQRASKAERRTLVAQPSLDTARIRCRSPLAIGVVAHVTSSTLSSLSNASSQSASATELVKMLVLRRAECLHAGCFKIFIGRRLDNVMPSPLRTVLQNSHYWLQQERGDNRNRGLWHPVESTTSTTPTSTRPAAIGRQYETKFGCPL